MYNSLKSTDFNVNVAWEMDTKATLLEEYYGWYGGLLFLGILLGGVFALAAALIMYYKQISEGFEDAARFEILRKVGMTRREIKSAINSQVLKVFFLPLVTAGIHMAFSVPMIAKMLINRIAILQKKTNRSLADIKIEVVVQVFVLVKCSIIMRFQNMNISMI